MKKKCIPLLLIFMTVLLCLYLIPVKRTINQNFPCLVLDQQDKGYEDHVTVIFTGTYTDYLFKQDIFKGRLEIEGYTFLHPDSKDIEIQVGNYELSLISEFTPVYNAFRTRATFYGREDFESFILLILIPDEEDPTSAHGRYFLTYPERTLEEISEILS